ncbi:hypothetical protein HELRODRAFT_159375 [Helobdella robusta]|uniref:Uncharacterized protein n=1 Tax=Helobdella robusta TaxID=6412 RepID=T1ENY9_HELRO|nr:hypothetical protein HELRODRAFT_159375 [Helobdella robusta]ESO12790.1 hypothetical protein HELRODRAFT_159375 [Helobdella robusta]
MEEERKFNSNSDPDSGVGSEVDSNQASPVPRCQVEDGSRIKQAFRRTAANKKIHKKFSTLGVLNEPDDEFNSYYPNDDVFITSDDSINSMKTDQFGAQFTGMANTANPVESFVANSYVVSNSRRGVMNKNGYINKNITTDNVKSSFSVVNDYTVADSVSTSNYESDVSQQLFDKSRIISCNQIQHDNINRNIKHVNNGNIYNYNDYNNNKFNCKKITNVSTLFINGNKANINHTKANNVDEFYFINSSESGNNKTPTSKLVSMENNDSSNQHTNTFNINSQFTFNKQHDIHPHRQISFPTSPSSTITHKPFKIHSVACTPILPKYFRSISCPLGQQTPPSNRNPLPTYDEVVEFKKSSTNITEDTKQDINGHVIERVPLHNVQHRKIFNASSNSKENGSLQKKLEQTTINTLHSHSQIPYFCLLTPEKTQTLPKLETPKSYLPKKYGKVLLDQKMTNLNISKTTTKLNNIITDKKNNNDDDNINFNNDNSNLNNKVTSTENLHFNKSSHVIKSTNEISSLNKIMLNSIKTDKTGSNRKVERTEKFRSTSESNQNQTRVSNFENFDNLHHNSKIKTKTSPSSASSTPNKMHNESDVDSCSSSSNTTPRKFFRFLSLTFKSKKTPKMAPKAFEMSEIVKPPIVDKLKPNEMSLSNNPINYHSLDKNTDKKINAYSLDRTSAKVRLNFDNGGSSNTSTSTKSSLKNKKFLRSLSTTPETKIVHFENDDSSAVHSQKFRTFELKKELEKRVFELYQNDSLNDTAKENSVDNIPDNNPNSKSQYETKKFRLLHSSRKMLIHCKELSLLVVDSNINVETTKRLCLKRYQDFLASFINFIDSFVSLKSSANSLDTKRELSSLGQELLLSGLSISDKSVIWFQNGSLSKDHLNEYKNCINKFSHLCARLSCVLKESIE